MAQRPKIGIADSGVKIEDLLDSREFMSRNLEKSSVADREARARERLKSCGDVGSDRILQELMEIAVEFCNADSAGISLEEVNDKGEQQFRWIAVAGSFSQYLNGTTPRFYSPCGTCVDRGVPQLYQVTLPYYNFLGVNAEPIRNGILIPWLSETMQGTLWLVSHGSDDAFDKSDYEFMRIMSDLVAREFRNVMHP